MREAGHRGLNIHTAPVEIWSRIFHESRKSPEDVHTAVRVSHVSRRFRTISLGAGTLWSTIIHRSPRDLARTEAFLERSKLSPITLKLTLLHADLVKKRSYAKTVAVILRILERVRTFHLVIDDRMLDLPSFEHTRKALDLLRAAAPELEELMIHYGDAVISSGPLFLGLAPKLHSLQLSTAGRETSQSFLSEGCTSLKTACITVAPAAGDQDLPGLPITPTLHAHRDTLVSLDLNVTDATFQVPSAFAPVVFSRLETFRIETKTFPILSSIYSTSLRHIAINSPQGYLPSRQEGEILQPADLPALHAFMTAHANTLETMKLLNWSGYDARTADLVYQDIDFPVLTSIDANVLSGFAPLLSSFKPCDLRTLNVGTVRGSAELRNMAKCMVERTSATLRDLTVNLGNIFTSGPVPPKLSFPYLEKLRINKADFLFVDHSNETDAERARLDNEPVSSCPDPDAQAFPTILTLSVEISSLALKKILTPNVKKVTLVGFEWHSGNTRNIFLHWLTRHANTINDLEIRVSVDPADIVSMPTWPRVHLPELTYLSLVRGEEIIPYLDCPKLDELLVIHRNDPPTWGDSISLESYSALRKITLSQDGGDLHWAPRLLSPLPRLKEFSITIQRAKDAAGREVPLLKALARIDPNTGLWPCPSLTSIRLSFCTDEPAGFDYPALRDVVEMRAKGGVASPLELVHISSLSTLHVSAAAGKKALEGIPESASFDTVSAYPTEEFLESAAIPRKADAEWLRDRIPYFKVAGLNMEEALEDFESNWI